MFQNRKFLGMTGSQIGILAGMALLVFCLFGVIGYLVYGGGFSFGANPEEIPTPNPTVTLMVNPTVTPTALPTPIPYEQLIPTGWIQYRTALLEVWYPPAFKLSKNQNLKGATTFAVPELVVSKPAAKAAIYSMWAAVSYEPLTTDSLDSFLDVKLESLAAGLRVADRRRVVLNGIAAERILIEGRVDTFDINELAYVIQDGGTVWYVLYVARINEFYDNLELFEASARTFRLVK
jgi:hypothetical protein